MLGSAGTTGHLTPDAPIGAVAPRLNAEFQTPNTDFGGPAGPLLESAGFRWRAWGSMDLCRGSWHRGTNPPRI